MIYIMGFISSFITNITNIFEVIELSKNRDNYNSYQGLLVSIVAGLLFALFLDIFLEIKIHLVPIMIFYSGLWILKVLVSFYLTTKVHPITHKLLYSLSLPVVLIMDMVVGNIGVDITIILSFLMIFGMVVIRIYKSRENVMQDIGSIKLLLILFVGLIASSYSRVLRYRIRTEYDIGTLDFMLTNGIIAICMYFLFIVAIREFNPKSIVKNRKSHLKASVYSVVQQFLEFFMSGYIPASIGDLFRSIMGYLVVPISRRDKDNRINKVDKNEYLYFIINVMGTILILSAMF